MRFAKILFPVLFLGVSMVIADSWTLKVLPDKAPYKETLIGEYVPLDIDTSNYGVGMIYFPPDYKPGKKGFDLLIHFHTSPWLIEQEFAKTGRKAVIVTINYNGLSAVYRIPFQTDTTLFQKILDQTVAAVKTKYPHANPKIHRLALSSFSAGYGAIREILKQPVYYKKINEVVLADSLYAGFTDTTARVVDAKDVASFVPFVKDAVKGKKRFISVHSSYLPPDYAGTPETNAYLISIAGGKAKYFSVDTSTTGFLYQKFDKGDFHVRGYTGTIAISHMSQVYAIKNWYEGLEIGK